MKYPEKYVKLATASLVYESGLRSDDTWYDEFGKDLLTSSGKPKFTARSREAKIKSERKIRNRLTGLLRAHKKVVL